MPVPAAWSAPSGAPARPAHAATPAPSAAVVRYYVVAPGNGQREYLCEIAAKTLGNGNRYQEIFDLNKAGSSRMAAA